VRTLLESAGATFGIARYAKGTQIFRQGDNADTVLHVESGRALLAVTAATGKEAITGIAEPGTFLGEEALVGRTVRLHTATTMTATTVLVVAKAEMAALLSTQPALSSRFIAFLITRQFRLETNLIDQLLSCGEERLAHTLLHLAGCNARHLSSVLPSVSQEIIAEMVGTTRSRVNFFMGRFKKAGFIYDNGGALHVDSRCLSRIHSRHPAVS